MQYPAQYGATVAPSYYGTPYGATTALPGAQYSAVPAYGSSAYGYGQPYGYYPSSTSYRSTSRHHGHHGHYGYGHGYIADAEQKVVGGLEKFAGYVTGDPMLVERGRRRQMSTSYVPTSAYGSGRYAYGTPRGYYY
ncbi:hypothetical protein PsYK624_045520 [Phanerochaete sordida]|uniref:Uncharacterized protein n=1 Tax=Phanerochaete sordida TaxID=48140 RepID=A0A9P3G5Y2_9APHY|nr:hypothetical protein PsYK624_045520 [Phanerochaete sordida]